MRLAIPLTATGMLAERFGSALRFDVFEVDLVRPAVGRRITVLPSCSAPCRWPMLLRCAGVDLLLAHRISMMARARMTGLGIGVQPGVPVMAPVQLVTQWLPGRLPVKSPACDRPRSSDGFGPFHRPATPA